VFVVVKCAKELLGISAEITAIKNDGTQKNSILKGGFMFEFIITLIITVSIALTVYFMWVIIANDRATEWIVRRKDSIKSEFSRYGYRFYSLYTYDAAPCEIKYGINLKNLGDMNKYVIPSRKMKRILTKLLSNKISVKEAYNYVIFNGDLVDKSKPTFRIDEPAEDKDVDNIVFLNEFKKK
jgi:hypothetical protein